METVRLGIISSFAKRCRPAFSAALTWSIFKVLISSLAALEALHGPHHSSVKFEWPILVAF